MAINDAVDWRADLGGGTTVALDPGRHVPLRRRARSSARCRGSCGATSSTDEIDDEHRLLQALNCLLIETPAGRVLVETGIGERVDDKTRAMRATRGRAIVPALETAGFQPETVDVVAMSHLHFDHAGGLLRADGDARLPARDDRGPEGRVGGRPRRQPAARRLVRPARADAGPGLGRRRAGPTASGSCCRA